MNAVHQVQFDKVPYPPRGGEKFFVMRQFKGVDESYHSLGLRPAFPAGINNLAVPALVIQTAVRPQPFLE